MSEMKHGSDPEKEKRDSDREKTFGGTAAASNKTEPAAVRAARPDLYDRICMRLLRGGRFWRAVGGLLRRGRQPVLYIFFGALTTVVDLAVYYPLKFSLPETRLGTVAANAAAWMAAVAFAFFTNKRFVFSDRRRRLRTVILQWLSFASGRLLSFGLETGILLAGDAVLAAWASSAGAIPGILAYVPKLLAQVLVLILNFLISKFFVFRRSRERGRR